MLPGASAEALLAPSARRQLVGPVDGDAGSYRAGVEDTDGDGGGFVDDEVVVRRAPVVGVADVAAVDEQPETTVAVECEGAARRVDVDARAGPLQGEPVSAGVRRVGRLDGFDLGHQHPPEGGTSTLVSLG